MSNWKFMNMRLPVPIATVVEAQAAKANMTPYEFCARVVTQRCCPNLEGMLDTPHAKKRRGKGRRVIEKEPVLVPAPPAPISHVRMIYPVCEHPLVAREQTVRGIYCAYCNTIIEARGGFKP